MPIPGTVGFKAPPPLPGQYWPEQQGYYAGITPSGWHLILPDSAAHYFTGMVWGKYGETVTGADSEHDGLANTIAMAEAGSDLAQKIRALPGDCYLPSRFESALLYVTLRDQIKTGEWYWTSTQDSANDAWCQGFDGGLQYDLTKSFEARARAVRRLRLQSFNPSDSGAV